MLRRPRAWLARQDRINRTAVVAAALGLIGFAAYRVWEYRAAERRADEARAALERRDHRAARAILAECLAERPDSGELTFLAARAARMAGDTRAANDLLGRSERLGWPGEAVAIERMLTRAGAGEFRAVEPALVKFALADPPSPEADLALEVAVQCYMAEYDLGPALTLLKAGVARRPGDVRLRVWRYEVARRLQLQDEATEAIRAAADLAPDDPEIRLKLGEQLLAVHAAGEAKPHFERLLGQDPDRPAYRFGLARCERELGETAAAVRTLDDLLARDPGNARYLAERGYADLFAGRPHQALPHLRAAADRAPFETDLLGNLAVCLEQCGKPDEAKGCRDRAARAEADVRELQDLTGRVRANPRDPEPRYRAGTLLARNGQRDEARRWFESALRLDPNHAPARRALADLPPQPRVPPPR